MATKPAFQLYNASAGSGKIYTLVREYLKQLLQATTRDYYRSLLAITFTNKAVAEMKQRIIGHLTEFSKTDSLSEPPTIMLQLADECDLSLQEIAAKSKTILHHILHNYAGFSVETIDGFNHRLIRTFAKDLHIASNFDVTLEENQLLEQAVDQLLNMAGEDEKITGRLVEFTFQKTDDDRSWDIARDITEASKILFSENDSAVVNGFRELSLDDFITIENWLRSGIEDLSQSIEHIAKQTLQLIEESGLQHNDFSGGYFPKYFVNLLEGKTDRYEGKWQQELTDKPLYPGRVLKKDPHTAQVMDELASQFAEAFQQSKDLVFRRRLLENILKNLIPLSVINLVRQQIDNIKEEENILPISEFNQIINKEIKHQPAPFIYERLGERYKHFFIDEFQDTSLLQWENLIPLIDNALSQEYTDGRRGSLLLVGDAKQSIYRWRGGLPEQFIALYNQENPFSVEDKLIENLETNFRSKKEIIEFNNSFFSRLAGCFNDELHNELYTIGNRQQSTDKAGGFVQLEFLQAVTKDELASAYGEKVVGTIADLRNRKFSFSDICILTRTKQEGISIGERLMEEGIPVVSSESLMLRHSPMVNFLADCLQLKTFPDNDEVKARILMFLYDHLKPELRMHDFLKMFFPSEHTDFETVLSDFGISFSFERMNSLSLYELCEYLIIVFKLQPWIDAYTDGFLNLVHEFEAQASVLKTSFAEYWEQKKEKAAISTGEGVDAVRLMTIHKAKGLEFPVVLFPFADLDIYKEIKPKAWYPADEFNRDFECFQIDFKKEVENYGEAGREIYVSRRNKLQLDNLNLLYVALTRAVNELHIFCSYPKDSKDGQLKKYNQFFSDFLKYREMWKDEQLVYTFGRAQEAKIYPEAAAVAEIEPVFQSSFPFEHNLTVSSREASLWLSAASEAIESGTLLHDMMTFIEKKDDIEALSEKLLESNLYTQEEINSLISRINTLTDHSELKQYFDGNNRVENERDIITSGGEILRPDRLNFHPDDSVTVIDYKTGGESPAHKQQIQQYAAAINEMGFVVRDMVIIYISDQRILINKL